MELVERGELLATLSAYLADARAASGRLVFLSEEAGVGKTSLARAFMTQESGVRVLWGACDPLATPEPAAPFLDMAPLATVLAGKPVRVELLKSILDELRPAPVTVMVVEDAHAVALDPGGPEPGIALTIAQEPAEALDQAIGRGMLVLAGERVAFRHELARLAIEAAIPESRWRRLHRQLLERLSAGATTSVTRSTARGRRGQSWAR